MNEMVKVDLTEYGLDETKAAAIRKDFDAVLKIAEELEGGFNEVVKKAEDGITQELTKEAKALRLKFVKVRTGIAQVHKERKAFYLSGGRAVDGLKNAYTHAVEGNEKRLEQIEKHFELIEKERVEKLEAERLSIAEKFDVDARLMRLGEMDEDVWTNYIAGVELQYNARKEAERKAEEERIAKEKSETEERERIRHENERLKSEAEERERTAKIESEKRAKEEAERVAKEAVMRKRIEDELRKEREEAERKLAAERAYRERIESEQKAKEAAEQKAKEEAERLAKNKAHCAKVHNEAMASLVELGLDAELAKSVVKAIVSDKIKHVSISY